MTWVVTAWALMGTCALWLRQRRRMELVARALHELRTPLCAARLAAHAAGRERGWPAVARVDEELGRAALALDDLEAARRGRTPAPSPEDVDTGALLAQVGATWAPLAWPVGRRVRVEPSSAAPVLRAEPARVAQALGNLVGNALEHGTGDVVLSVEVANRCARLVVADAGSGLPAPLGTLRRRARGGRGSRGRGLAIAAEIAERHGGRLVDASDGGPGCRMALELPLAAAEVQRSPLALRFDDVVRRREAGAWSVGAATGDADLWRWVRPARRRHS